MEPLISVIVPIYNVEAYLSRCVDSLLGQSYRNLEIILVDDGSPDGCAAICDAYAEGDKRVRVIHQENRGLSGARNAGIEMAQGDYLAFVDSDDYVSGEFIRELYEAIRETGCQIAQSRFAYVRGEPLSGQGSAFRKLEIYRERELMEKLYGPEEESVFFVVAWNKLYRRELFQTGIRYPEGRIHEDEATTHRLFHEGRSLAFVEKALYGYFLGNSGSITSVFSRKRLQWLLAQEERIAFFEKNGYEKLVPAAYRRLLDACITFYFRCTDEVEDARALRRELKGRLRTYRRRGAKEIRALPAQTRIGYRLFLLSPVVYQKVLKRKLKHE